MIDASIARLAVPVLVIRGRDDVLSSVGQERRLAGQTADGDYVELAGAHTFPEGHPSACPEPTRAFAGRLL